MAIPFFILPLDLFAVKVVGFVRWSRSKKYYFLLTSGRTDCIEDLVCKTLHLFVYDRYRYTEAGRDIYIYIVHSKRGKEQMFRVILKYVDIGADWNNDRNVGKHRDRGRETKIPGE